MTHAPLKNKLAGLLIVVFASALIAPAFASAQQVSPADNQYSDQVAQVSQGDDGGTPGSTPTSKLTSASTPDPTSASGLSARVGPLPFTGFDVIAMAAVALAVTGLGLALQRAVSHRPSDLT